MTIELADLSHILAAGIHKIEDTYEPKRGHPAPYGSLHLALCAMREEVLDKISRAERDRRDAALEE